MAPEKSGAFQFPILKKDYRVNDNPFIPLGATNY